VIMPSMGLDFLVTQTISTPARAPLVWGSPEGHVHARYISIAMVSAARACSRWPSVAYSVPRPSGNGAWSGRMPSASARAKSLVVMGGGLVDVRGSAMHGDLA